jgi:C4-dicarboxylate-specific signal transduction histidine kinase
MNGRTPQPPFTGRKRLEDLVARSGSALASLGEQEAQQALPLATSLQRLLELSRNMNQIQQRDELLTYIQERLCELFEAENSKVILVGHDGSFLVLDAEGDEEGDAFSETLLRRVLAERQPVLVLDTAEDAELQGRGSVTRMGLVSALCAPLIVNDRIIGVIQFEHRSRPSPFSERDRTLLQLFASQAATALANVLLSEEREQALDKLREAQARLVTTETLRALGQMAAGVAHDFNNMLSSILGLSDLILVSGNLPHALRPDLETIKSCALDGAAAVQRLQEFAGGASGEQDRECVLVGDSFAQVAAMLDHRLRQHVGMPVHTLVIEGDETPAVLAQPSELRDVVHNLALNALDAMPEGGQLTLRALSRDGRVVLEVEDEGTGIAPEVRQRIFEPFFTTKANGHGLGLSICWGIVRRLGGGFDIRPGGQGGTVMVIDLPPAPPQALDHRRRVETGSAASTVARVLLVDDDAMVRHVLGRMLQAGGHEVEDVSSGALALERLEHGGAYDLVITDYGMPGMDGHSLAKRISNGWPDLPVIVITGWNPGGPERVGQVPCLRSVLRKPVTAQDLLAAVAQVQTTGGA